MTNSTTGRWVLLLAGIALASFLPITLGLSLGGPLITERVSVSSTDGEGNGASLAPSVSDDGRFVAFASDATNLVLGDSNGFRDIFVHDRTAGTTELVSLSSANAPGNATSGGLDAGPPRLSADGRYVVFSSSASNLVPNDSNGVDDIFVRDRLSGTTERVSIDSSGPLDSEGVPGNAQSITPSISGDGRLVTFTSRADNLVDDDNNDTWDAFLHDRIAGTTELLSVATDGTQGSGSSAWLGAGAAQISADGRFVVFGSFADNLVADDTNHVDDIFLRDLMMGTTERVSLNSDEVEGTDHSMYGSMSDDGRYVAFFSFADNLVATDENGVADVFVRDRTAGTTVRASEGTNGEGNGASRFPAVNADGGFVVFQTEASNLVPGDDNGATDIVCFDIAQGTLLRVSVTDDGVDPTGASVFADLSADGLAVAYRSDASNLATADDNGVSDVFVWGKRLQPPATPIPTATPEPEPNGDVTGDGVANSLDALFILQFTAGLLDSLPNLSNADVSGDGAIGPVDAALILQFDAGLLGQLPP